MNPAYISTIIVVISIFFYVFELLPIPIVAMLSCAMMVIFKVITPAVAWAGFASDTVLLVVGSGVVGAAIFHTKATDSITKIILKLAGGKPNLAIYLLILFGGLISSLMNNITSAVIFFPIIIGIIAKTNSGKVYEQKYMQLLAMFTPIGGMLTLVGSSMVLTASGISEASGGGAFTFLQFTPIGCILFAVLVIYMFLFNDKFSDKVFGGKIGYHSEFVENMTESLKKEEASKANEEQIKPSGFFSNKKLLSTLIMLLMVAGFLTQKFHGISLGSVAIICALLCVVTKCFTLAEMCKNVDLNVVMIITGMVGTASGFASSGGGDMVAGFVLGLLGKNVSVTLIYAVICLMSAALTQLMSNTGTAGIFIPIACSLALKMGVSPIPFVTGITLCCVCAFMTPMANPIAAMVYNWGSYSFNDYLKYATPLTVILVAISIILPPIFYPF